MYYIYKIKIGRCFYYGYTCDFNRRKREHINQLETNTHTNDKMQTAYNKHRSVSVEMVHRFPFSLLALKVEQFYLHKYRNHIRCLNESSNNGSCKEKDSMVRLHTNLTWCCVCTIALGLFYLFGT